MFNGFSLFVLIPIFIAGAVAVWIAGTQLSKTTDILDDRFHLGQALGGLIFLAIATNLPEIAITTTAGVTHHLGLAIGNILGGIAMQTLVLVLLDAFGLGGKDPLTYRGASLELVLEGAMLIAILVVAIMGTQLPKSLIVAHITPGSLLMLVLWLVGLWLLSKAHRGLPWQDSGRAPDRSEPPPPQSKQQDSKDKKRSTTVTLVIFGIAALVTLVAGVALEESSNAIADKIGLSNVLFGATVLAAATALPEVSTGFAAVKLQQFELAMSDIFGGNAFLPVLFLLADVLSGQDTLAQAKNSDIYLACLGVLLTTVYIYGLIFRPRLQVLKMGIDSFIVLILYILGIGGLVAIALTTH